MEVGAEFVLVDNKMLVIVEYEVLVLIELLFAVVITAYKVLNVVVALEFVNIACLLPYIRKESSIQNVNYRKNARIEWKSR